MVRVLILAVGVIFIGLAGLGAYWQSNPDKQQAMAEIGSKALDRAMFGDGSVAEEAAHDMQRVLDEHEALGHELLFSAPIDLEGMRAGKNNQKPSESLIAISLLSASIKIQQAKNLPEMSCAFSFERSQIECWGEAGAHEQAAAAPSGKEKAQPAKTKRLSSSISHKGSGCGAGKFCKVSN